MNSHYGVLVMQHILVYYSKQFTTKEYNNRGKDFTLNKKKLREKRN